MDGGQAIATDQRDTSSVARNAIRSLIGAGDESPAPRVLDRLNSASGLRTAVDAIMTDLVIAARDDGATWAEIGEVLGVSTQAAHQKYRHVAAVAEANAS